jgi:hypothetical protein
MNQVKLLLARRHQSKNKSENLRTICGGGGGHLRFEM